jgi:hypothetical protein
MSTDESCDRGMMDDRLKWGESKTEHMSDTAYNKSCDASPTVLNTALNLARHSVFDGHRT